MNCLSRASKSGGAGGLGRGGSGFSGVGSVKGTISPSEIRTALPGPGRNPGDEEAGVWPS